MSRESELFLGVNYHPPEYAFDYWKEWGEGVIQVLERDFRKMRELGLNCVRLFLRSTDFYDKEERVNPEMLSRLDELLSIAEKESIRPIVSLWNGHMSGASFKPDWLKGSLYSPSNTVKEIKLMKQVIVKFKGDKRIAQWDISNEPCNDEGPQDHKVCHRWNAEVYRALKEVDPGAKVALGEGFGKKWGFWIEEVWDDNDYKMLHTYAPHDLKADPVASTYYYPFQFKLVKNVGGMPTVLEEFGFPTHKMDEEKQAQLYRCVLYSMLLSGWGDNLVGVLPWCWSDFPADRYPYSESLAEQNCGIYHLDGTPKKAAHVFSEFCCLVRELDSGFIKKPAKIGILLSKAAYSDEWVKRIVPERLERNCLGAFIHCKQNQHDADVIREEEQENLSRYALVILPSVPFVSKSYVQRLTDYVSSGGTLFVLGPLPPNWGATTLNKLLDSAKTEEIPSKYRFSATPIRVNQQGKGEVIFVPPPVSYPLEGSLVGAREIYRMVIEKHARIKNDFVCDNPDVEVGMVMRKDKKEVIIAVNHSDETKVAKVKGISFEKKISLDPFGIQIF